MSGLSSAINKHIKDITNLECIYNTLDWDMRISAPKDSKDYIISLEGNIADKILWIYDFLFNLITTTKCKDKYAPIPPINPPNT